MTTLLIVDDDLPTRMFLEAFLRFEGYHVRLASHGQEALAILDTVACDLVLMDIQMPVLDGYQATQRIKEQTQYERFLPI
ncbi:MAG: response regulator, partial [Magnetococcales bacterium]|nr:response regulator [Magnetococcales bacterium]